MLSTSHVTPLLRYDCPPAATLAGMAPCQVYYRGNGYNFFIFGYAWFHLVTANARAGDVENQNLFLHFGIFGFTLVLRAAAGISL